MPSLCSDSLVKNYAKNVADIWYSIDWVKSKGVFGSMSCRIMGKCFQFLGCYELIGYMTSTVGGFDPLSCNSFGWMEMMMNWAQGIIIGSFKEERMPDSLKKSFLHHSSTNLPCTKLFWKLSPSFQTSLSERSCWESDCVILFLQFRDFRKWSWGMKGLI